MLRVKSEQQQQDQLEWRGQESPTIVSAGPDRDSSDVTMTTTTNNNNDDIPPHAAKRQRPDELQFVGICTVPEHATLQQQLVDAFRRCVDAEQRRANLAEQLLQVKMTQIAALPAASAADAAPTSAPATAATTTTSTPTATQPTPSTATEPTAMSTDDVFASLPEHVQRAWESRLTEATAAAAAAASSLTSQHVRAEWQLKLEAEHVARAAVEAQLAQTQRALADALRVKQRLIEYMKHHYLSELHNPHSRFATLSRDAQQLVELYTTGTSAALFIAGGRDAANHIQGNAFRLLLAKNEWHTLPTMLEPRAALAACVAQQFLMVLGGTASIASQYSALSTVEAFTQDQPTWFAAPSMLYGREGLGAVYAENRLFAVGGRTGIGPSTRYLSSVECHSGGYGDWSEVASLRSPRFNAAVAAGSAMLYVAGGASSATSSLVTAERLDLHSLQSVPLRSLSIPRSNCTGVVLERGRDVFFVLGGGGTERTSYGERYDGRSGYWSRIAATHSVRNFASTVCIDGVVYVLGGATPQAQPLASAERYDEAADRFTEAAFTLPVPLKSFAAAVLAPAVPVL